MKKKIKIRIKITDRSLKPLDPKSKPLQADYKDSEDGCIVIPPLIEVLREIEEEPQQDE
jgi:hypothetical protein